MNWSMFRCLIGCGIDYLGRRIGYLDLLEGIIVIVLFLFVSVIRV